jgi:protein TonB
LIGNIPDRRGVYLGMFEQSLLTHPAGTRKTATFAASLTAQILVAGVLVVAPLFYHDVLPAFRVPAYVPPLTLWRPPEAAIAAASTPARSSGLAVPDGFRPVIVLHSDYPQTSFAVIDYDTLATPATSTISALPIGSSASLSQLEAPKAPAVQPEVVTPIPATLVRVGGNVQSAKLTKQVVPIYPRPAVQMRISGTVQLLGIIAKDGTIQRLQVLSGHPLLRQAAIDAVSQWVYRPTILNGQPVEVEAPIDVIFNLSR